MTEPDADEALLERIARGERGAMQVLYGRHSTRVYRFLLRLVRDPTTADDLVSDVFFDVWQQADRFEGRASVVTWMFAIARFKALSTRRRRTHTSIDDDTIVATLADAADTPEIVVQKTSKGEAMRRCLDALSAEHREVIDLVYYHDFSVDEVAQITGAPPGTVKTRMFHARKRLSDLLSAAGIDRGWP